MDIQDEDILKLGNLLNKNEVQYIMVGGFATNIHGYNRVTADIDIWLNDSIENRNKFKNTLNEIGAGDFPIITTMQFVAGCTRFKMPQGIEIDVMTTMKGLEEFTFDYCLSVATIATIENVTVPFLHINQLIQNKKAVNRPKDQIDVMELEKIELLREQLRN